MIHSTCADLLPTAIKLLYLLLNLITIFNFKDHISVTIEYVGSFTKWKVM